MAKSVAALTVAVMAAVLIGRAPVACFPMQLFAAQRLHQPAACTGCAQAVSSHVCFYARRGSVSRVTNEPRTARGKCALRASGKDGADGRPDPAEFNRQPGESEIKTLLTQRALQNLIFLLELERDQITADWMEAWQGHENIRRYHGLAGLHLGGRAYIAQLLRAPNEERVVEFVRRGNGGHGGSPERAAALGSGGNPYLKDHVYEFKTKIEPRRLGDRLLRLRADIAEEWLEDLHLFPKENEEMWRSFFETVRENEDKLKDLQMPVWQHDPSDGPSGTSFRGGNYDLLRRLATRNAIAMLLAELRGGGLEAQAKADYLDRMYTVHGTDFEGDGPYHTDKTFFQALLSSAPSIVRKQTSADEEKIIMLSPISIVEAICEKREKIAEEWCKELVNIKEDHTDIQRELLQELY